jgi:replication factor C subunit 1
MLTDKYKPNSFDNFVGNIQNITLIQNWLCNWDIKNKINKKCLLISGPSGIGKTLCIELLIKKYNLNPIYISNDEKVDKEFFINYIIPSIQIEKNILSKRNILIINDIDCYDDHGFISNINMCIKESKISIIATCNNRYEQSIKPIINNCYDIKFQKPSVIEITKFLIPIFKSENYRISEPDIKKLIENVNHDIRNILLNLQLNLQLNFTKSLNSKDKNISQTNIFDLTKSFLSQNIEINDKYSLFWLNNDLLPLMIHENYPLNNIKMKDENLYLQNISDTISSLSDIDLIDKEIRTTATNWELSPYIAWNLIKSVNNCHPKSQIKFTEFLIKNSKKNKNMKLTETNKEQNEVKKTINSKKTIQVNTPKKSCIKKENIVSPKKQKKKYNLIIED